MVSDWEDDPQRAVEMPAPLALCRGVARTLLAADLAVVPELPLANGRRADLAAIDRHGEITIIEIKTSRADFRSDHKWQQYLEYCDCFFFAVPAGFPQAVLPPEHGLLLADAFGAEVVRPGSRRPLNAARRKAVLLRFARAAAMRLQAHCDPAV